MGPAFCNACGASLGEEAKFCRVCGNSLQAPVAPTPPPPPTLGHKSPPAPPPPPTSYPPVVAPPHTPVAVGSRTASPATTTAAILAIGGGLGMCLITLYAIVYRPLHFHDPVNFGESLQFGDLFMIGAGLVAVAVGVSALRSRGNGPGRAALLALAGIPSLVLTVVWSFPTTFHVTLYPELPFYAGFVFVSELGNVRVGQDGEVPLPLLAACLAVVLAALISLVPAGEAQPFRRQ